MQSKIAICSFTVCAALFPPACPALAGSADAQLKGSTRIEPSFHDGNDGLNMLLDQLVYLLPAEGDGKGTSMFIRAGASPSDRTLIDE